MARNGSGESEARQIDRMSTALRVVEQLAEPRTNPVPRTEEWNSSRR